MNIFTDLTLMLAADWELLSGLGGRGLSSGGSGGKSVCCLSFLLGGIGGGASSDGFAMPVLGGTGGFSSLGDLALSPTGGGGTDSLLSPFFSKSDLL